MIDNTSIVQRNGALGISHPKPYPEPKCWRAFVAIIVAFASGLSCTQYPEKESNQQPNVAVLPRSVLDEGYVSSKSCQSCHPDEHSSWHRSYHRTMTQVASPTTVVAPMDDTILESRGRKVHFQRVNDEFFAEVTNLHNSPEALRTTRARVEMTTGSHHMQTYWAATGRGNELQQIPWYYHILEQRWIPAEDSYLVSPDTQHTPVTWNTVCIVCHSVRGRPLPDSETGFPSSDVVELGIACEACHGPAEQHIRKYRESPVHVGRDGEETLIINPARLSHRHSSEVCGQCHSTFSPPDTDDWLQHGYRFRPGKKTLIGTHNLVRYEHYQGVATDLGFDTFWGDGTQRVGGREYTAMIESACFQRGELSCLSCHSMHDSDPNDQLAEHLMGDQSCLQCHESYAEKVEEHTHHPAHSSGSKCSNCHMSHTSYALFKAIRSHRIDSPSAAISKQTGRPNACNQCHLDQTLDWTARHLTNWYGVPEVEFDCDEREVAAAPLWLLKGDAVQRAVTAWTLAWQPAVAISGSDWQPPLLAQALDDPYSAVRFVAYRSLKKFPGFENFEYDFVASMKHRTAAKQQALHIWRNRGTVPRMNNRVLIGENGQLLDNRMQKLAKQRDNRRLLLQE